MKKKSQKTLLLLTVITLCTTPLMAQTYDFTSNVDGWASGAQVNIVQAA